MKAEDVMDLVVSHGLCALEIGRDTDRKGLADIPYQRVQSAVIEICVERRQLAKHCVVAIQEKQGWAYRTMIWCTVCQVKIPHGTPDKLVHKDQCLVGKVESEES